MEGCKDDNNKYLKGDFEHEKEPLIHVVKPHMIQLGIVCLSY